MLVTHPHAMNLSSQSVSGYPFPHHETLSECWLHIPTPFILSRVLVTHSHCHMNPSRVLVTHPHTMNLSRVLVTHSHTVILSRQLVSVVTHSLTVYPLESVGYPSLHHYPLKTISGYPSPHRLSPREGWLLIPTPLSSLVCCHSLHPPTHAKIS